MKKYILHFSCFLSLAASGLAHSMEAPNDSDTGAVANVGVQALLISDYLGSADEEVSVLPYLSVDDYKGIDIFGPAISYRAIETGTGQGLGKWSLRVGPSLTYQRGRDSDDSDTLTGFEDIDGSLLAGGYARATIGPIGLRLDAGQDILGGHDGLTVNASVGTVIPLGRLKIQPSATVNWATASHNQSFFGVTAEQAAISGLDVTDVDSGIHSYALSAVSWFEINDTYSINLIGSHSWFTNDAKDSPILQATDGADTGILVSVGLSRKFNL